MKKSITEIFMDLVKIPSLSTKEEKIRDYIIEYISPYKLNYKIDEIGNLIIDIKGESSQYLLFDAHMDTVGPCEKIIPIIRDNCIYSDGTSILGADDKAGIAVCLALIDDISKMSKCVYSMRFIFSVCEEIGLQGVKKLNSEHLQNVLYAFVLDGDGSTGNIIDKTPYSCKGDLVFKGKAAHAGVCPKDGINALYVAAHAIVKMPNGYVNENTTCNMGVVEGGVATNIVMSEVKIKFESRSFYLEELENLVDSVCIIARETADDFQAQFSSSLRFGTKGYHVLESEDIVQFFKRACDKCNLNFTTKSCGGASNANIYRQRGVSALNIGVGMKQVHTCQEYIEIKDLDDTYNLLRTLSGL